MKIVLDTNVLISGIFWSGAPFKVLELWQKDRFEVIATEPILNEYLRCIERISKKYKRPELFPLWSMVLPSRLTLVQVKKHFHVSRDPDDNKFIDCAVSGRARYLVSGDDDLLALGKFMNIEILRPQQFIQRLNG